MLEKLLSLGVSPEQASIMITAAEKAAKKQATAKTVVPTKESLEALGFSGEEAAAMVRAASPRGVSATMQRYAGNYVASKAGNSKHCGDKIATALDGLSPEQVCSVADLVKGWPEGTQLAKPKVNRGKVRMDAGNIIRSAYKRAIEEADKARMAQIEKWLGIATVLEEKPRKAKK